MSQEVRLRNRLIAWWESLWFEEVPPDSYALLRIVFGALGLVSVLELTPVSMFWPLDGITPIPGNGLGIRSYLLGVGLGTIVGWAYFSTLLIAFTSMTVGYMSRPSIVICFVGASFIPSWNHLPLSSANQVLTSVLFCLVWADCGSVLSLDAWLAARRRPGDSREERPAQAIWPLRLIRIQVCIIYLNSGLWKFFNAVWRDGAAVHYSISLNIFHRFPFTLPPSLDWTTTIATYATMFWEISFPLMMFHPATRRLALILGVLFHGGMWTMLELGPFSWMMIASYLAFLDPVAVSRMVSMRLSSPKKDFQSAT